jgi:hypothetical protein
MSRAAILHDLRIPGDFPSLPLVTQSAESHWSGRMGNPLSAIESTSVMPHFLSISPSTMMAILLSAAIGRISLHWLCRLLVTTRFVRVPLSTLGGCFLTPALHVSPAHWPLLHADPSPLPFLLMPLLPPDFVLRMTL